MGGEPLSSEISDCVNICHLVASDSNATLCMRYNISVLDLHLIKRASYYSKQTLELHVYSISLAYGMTGGIKTNDVNSPY